MLTGVTSELTKSDKVNFEYCPTSDMFTEALTKLLVKENSYQNIVVKRWWPRLLLTRFSQWSLEQENLNLFAIFVEELKLKGFSQMYFPRISLLICANYISLQPKMVFKKLNGFIRNTYFFTVQMITSEWIRRGML